MTTGADIRAGRLAAPEIAEAFGDLHPLLGRHEAMVEAERCCYCYDAPCVEACPTGIDIPASSARSRPATCKGAAQDHPRARTSSAACAPASARPRCCASRPACATRTEDKPVEIGAAAAPCHRRAVRPSRQPLFARAPAERASASRSSAPGRRGSPARIAWRMLGHDVTVFEADGRSPAGSTNTASPHTRWPTISPQREIDFMLAHRRHRGALRRGARQRRCARRSARATTTRSSSASASPASTRSASTASSSRASRTRSTSSPRLRQARGPGRAAGRPPRRRDRRRHDRDRRRGAEPRLGAEDVTIVYRRGPARDGRQRATSRNWRRPTACDHALGAAARGRWRGRPRARRRVRRRRARRRPARSAPARQFASTADKVFKAIGQTLRAGPARRRGRDRSSCKPAASRSTTSAGPRCPASGPAATASAGGSDLTVEAVEDGKLAALSIDQRCARVDRDEWEATMADLTHHFLRHPVAEPVLARLGAADRQGLQRRPRLRGRLGRRGLEDARREVRRSSTSTARATAPCTSHDRRVLGFNNIELITDRPLEREPRGDPAGQARLARPRAGRLAHGAVRRGRAGEAILPRSRTPAPTASSSTSAARTA